MCQLSIAHDQRRWEIFSLLDPDTQRPRRYPVQHLMLAIGGLRHATADLVRQQGFSVEWADRYCLGHDAGGWATATARPRYCVLPWLNRACDWVFDHLMLVLPRRDPVDWRQLNGWVNTNADKSQEEYRVGQDDFPEYTGRSKTWVTVTPVVAARSLYGIDFSAEKNLDFLRISMSKPIRPSRVTARSAAFYSGALGNVVGLPARQYRFPRHLPIDQYSVAHLRLEFDEEVSGPILAGLGQYRGYGLFRAI